MCFNPLSLCQWLVNSVCDSYGSEMQPFEQKELDHCNVTLLRCKLFYKAVPGSFVTQRLQKKTIVIVYLRAGNLVATKRVRRARRVSPTASPQHALRAFRCALAARACSRRPSLVQGRKLVQEARGLKLLSALVTLLATKKRATPPGATVL